MLTLRYSLQEQLWADSSAAAWRAIDQLTQSAVELRFLRLEDQLIRDRLTRRLRLAGMLHSRCARRVLALDLEGSQPSVVLEPPSPENLKSLLAATPELPVSTVLRLLACLAEGLAAAHVIGLTHVGLELESIGLTGDPQRPETLPKLDFSVGHRRPPGNPVDDVQALAAICKVLLSHATDQGSAGKALPPGLLARMDSPTAEERPTALEACRAFEESLAKIELGSSVPLSALPSNPPLSEDVNNPEFDRTFVSDIGQPELLPSAPNFELWADRTPPTEPAAILGKDPLEGRRTLGRFHLISKLGEGGMGTVWKARDPLDGSVVALKLLRVDRAGNEAMLKRFLREARILSEVHNPHVANLLEVNSDGDLHFITIEFVDGVNLLQYLGTRGRIDEREAAGLISDVARALCDAHSRGVIHRDLKPENVLVCRPPDGDGPPRAKLTDFGLARHVEETQSLALTTAGAVLGTPLYFSPEQCSGAADVDARADLYSLGATLFHLLTGRPPFESSSLLGLVNKHLNQPAPRLRSIVASVSEAMEEVVAKCLQKQPTARYQTAEELLRDLERLTRGEPTTLSAHPRLPPHDPKQVLTYNFEWQLENPPHVLWPHVSNTERLNRAIGLAAVDFREEPDPRGGSQRNAGFRKLGMNIAWREHPFEWIEGRRFGTLREFSQGPWKWFSTVVELTPASPRGTILTHRVCLLPSNLFGRVAGQIELGVKARRGLDAVYRRIDAVSGGNLGALADPFEAPPVLPPQAQRRLDERLQRVIALGGDPGVVDRLGEYLASAPPQELGRIRPLALAQRLGLEERPTLSVCLIGAREGLLTMLWDIICPLCRIPAQLTDTLKSIREHGRCNACQADFELDFANSIELIFRIAGDIQQADTGTYCVGGPAHSPHVVAQLRLGPGERVELDLTLSEGTYRLRGPQLPYQLDFRVVPQGVSARWDVDLLHAAGGAPPPALRQGGQLLALSNGSEHELVVRIERTASRSDACTAARAAATPLFRELFPGECLAPEQMVQVRRITLLATRLRDSRRLFQELGDSQAFQQIHAHFRRLDEIVRRAGGSLVKTVGEGVRAVFDDSAAATLAAMEVLNTGDPGLLAAVHRGPALVATINDLLDYFGASVHQVEWMLNLEPSSATDGRPRVLLSEAVANDPATATQALERGIRIVPFVPAPLLKARDTDGGESFGELPLLFELQVANSATGALPSRDYST